MPMPEKRSSSSLGDILDDEDGQYITSRSEAASSSPSDVLLASPSPNLTTHHALVLNSCQNEDETSARQEQRRSRPRHSAGRRQTRLSHSKRFPRALGCSAIRQFESSPKLENDNAHLNFLEECVCGGASNPVQPLRSFEENAASLSLYHAAHHRFFARFFAPETLPGRQQAIVPLTWVAVYYEHTFFAAAWFAFVGRR
jgi:hypothetical protein